jgi:TetR/AcrR family transcriptional regulator, cholesterol catabolism regulator
LTAHRQPMTGPAAESTKRRLSTVAARLFAQRGYHGTSIGDLAAALGIQKASVYSHIKGKEDLLAEIALAGAEAFHAALDAVPEGDPAERLRLALRAHLGVVDQQLEVATVWLNEWRYLTGSARERFLAERHHYERRIRRLFEDAVAAGALRADLDIRHAVLAFLSIGNWAYTWMAHTIDVDREAEAFWSLLVDGAGVRPFDP